MDPTDILTPFLNRASAFDPADWFHLVPKGTFRISRKEGDVLRAYEQVVDERAVEQIVANFNRQIASNPAFRVLIDFEHFSHAADKSSEAAAWINAMEARADGVWAKGDWSDAGETAIKNRRYRFLSPVWFPRQTEKITATRFRPIAVNDAALTNKPNLGDALQPFWNRAEEFPGREANNENQHSHMKERLIAMLSLAATATDEQLLAAVEGYKNRAGQADTLQTQLAAAKSEGDAFKNRYNTLLATSVDKTLGEYDGVLTAESKEAWKNRLTADYDGTVTLLKGIKPAGKKEPVHKGNGAGKDLPTDDADGTAPFMNRVREVMTADKLSETDAIIKVADAQPALYRTYAEHVAGGDE